MPQAATLIPLAASNFKSGIFTEKWILLCPQILLYSHIIGGRNSRLTICRDCGRKRPIAVGVTTAETEVAANRCSDSKSYRWFPASPNVATDQCWVSG
ncbi:hypothetical protein [Bacteroides thetaiotaomicron]|uniref:hypothetical protein n=1 Tax=Bacteroides thetaiotaomicron TaxID=818 RepID=UPI001C8C3B85|nr:hypothetical protein [Bacteroides thetaiotaomicron]